MSAPVVKVGDVAVHVERLFAGPPREIRRGAIVRETRTQWVDDVGTRWSKATGEKVPQYLSPRYLMSAAEYDAARKVAP